MDDQIDENNAFQHSRRFQLAAAPKSCRVLEETEKEKKNPDVGHNQLCAPMDALSVETVTSKRNMLKIAENGTKPIRAYRKGLASIPRIFENQDFVNQLRLASPTFDSMRSMLYRNCLLLWFVTEQKSSNIRDFLQRNMERNYKGIKRWVKLIKALAFLPSDLVSETWNHWLVNPPNGLDQVALIRFQEFVDYVVKYTIDSAKGELISLFSQMICSVKRYVWPSDTVSQTVIFYHYEKYTIGSAKQEFTSLFDQTVRSANRCSSTVAYYTTYTKHRAPVVGDTLNMVRPYFDSSLDKMSSTTAFDSLPISSSNSMIFGRSANRAVTFSKNFRAEFHGTPSAHMTLPLNSFRTVAFKKHIYYNVQEHSSY
uniref:Uncharacterized protein n=1 Tax=Romanomermis culicivorax TaxID=13658 RepID=A0A915INH8_ROMCU